MLCNSSSGLEVGLPGRILAGLLLGKIQNRLWPAEGQPESRFRFSPGSSPAKTRPRKPIYGPEALLVNIEYDGKGSDADMSQVCVSTPGLFCRFLWGRPFVR